MNIFKILANGDGTINEANISAFLGYLLDPYQDHGLGYEFLHRITKQISSINSESQIFYTQQYDYEILFEQAFRDENKSNKKKEIVDIVILCFENSQGKGKESIAKSIIENVRILKYIFLIENKVNVGAKAQHQLKNQYNNTLSSLKIDSSNVVSIYVTPDDKNYISEFNLFTHNDKKLHLVWVSDSEKPNNEDANESTKDENIPSIYSILKDILTDESKGIIEAINEYTKHTIISFMKFIENDFKSQFVEKKETKEGKFQKNIFATLEKYMGENKEILTDNSNNELHYFDNYVRTQYPKLFVRHTKTHPISILTNTKSGKIFSLTKYGNNLRCHFITRNFEDPNIKESIEKLIKTYSIISISTEYGINVTQELSIDRIIELFEEYIKIIANYTSNN